MTEAQKHLLMLFKEINDICLKHNIIYYMAGGTLIGAIRHKGFIPWDDDMDILMTRDNWLKFIEVCKHELPSNRALECQELNRNYRNMIGRYTDEDTSAIHENQVLDDSIAGYVVDILILDPISDKEEDYIRYRDDLLLYSDLINPTLNYSYRWGVNKKRYLKYYKKMKVFGKERVLSEIEKSLFQYKEEDCEKYVMRWGGAQFLFDKKMYGNSRWGIFEGIPCRIPDKTIDYLVWHYGDEWMYIPPHSKQESHNAIFSDVVSYKEIKNDYARYLNKKKYEKIIIKRKKYLFKSMKLKMDINKRKLMLMAAAAELRFKEQFSKDKALIERLFFNEDYFELGKYFNEYYDIQGSREYIGREDYLGIFRFNNPMLIDIDCRIFYIAIITLININKISKANRFIEVWEMNNKELNAELVRAKEEIKQIRKAVSNYDLGKKTASYNTIETLYKSNDKNVSVCMFWIKLLLENNEKEHAKNIIYDAIMKFPGMGEFYKYLGDYYFDRNSKKAYLLYDYALRHTNNGCLIMEMNEQLLKSKTDIMSLLQQDNNKGRVERISNILDSKISESC